MQALIDGDVIVYQCGFASDQKIYTAPDGAEFQYKKEAVEHCHQRDMDETDITSRVEPEPVEHCLHSVKIFINSIMENIDADDKKIFLTGAGQERLEKYPQYKANRDPTHKPFWYSEIKHYLIDHHDAEEIIALEADDAMAWHQWRDPGTKANDQLGAETCICTIDKDLNMVPGLHFNWKADGGKGDLFWVNPEEADRVFFEQWLTGDAADNIPGIRGVGAVKAERMLKHIPDGEYKMFQDAIIQTWLAQGTFPQGVDLREYVAMIGDLLWMQREPGQTWDQYYDLNR